MKHAFTLSFLLALASVAHADAWRVTSSPGELATPKRICRADFNVWLVNLASERPTIAVHGERLTITLGSTIMTSNRAVVGKDVAMGFWDQGKGVTLAVRVHPATAKIEILFIEHHSTTDRGDACYVEWRGDAERVP
jgi:hypothetical protein